MQKWEHNIIQRSYYEGSVSGWMDGFGAEGWELVTVIDNQKDYYRTYYFKRQVSSEEPPVTSFTSPDKMTEADKTREKEEILRRTNELTPAFKNKQNERNTSKSTESKS